MKAEELRIGNWVTVLSTVPCQVSAYHLLQMVSYKPKYPNEADYQEMTNPIPITEEWLLKFGFNYHRKAVPRPNWKTRDGFCLFMPDEEYKCTYFHFRDTFNTNMGRAEYVHQLQNLYYALTGKELEILATSKGL